MNRNEFLSLLTSTHSSLLSLTHSKGQEYAGSDDQLANFKRLGAKLGLRPEAVLLVFLYKHLDAIDSYVRNLSQGYELRLSEPIGGRIDDALLYLCLLKALIEDQNGIH